MADIDNFDLDKTTEQAWREFAERLGDVLSVMDGTEDLTIAVAGGDHPEQAPAIRFSVATPGTVTAGLVNVESSRLEEMGWQAGDGYSVTVDQDRVLELATLATNTMVEVVGVLHPVFLESEPLADVLNPAQEDDEPPARGPYGIVMPGNQAQLDAILDEELAGMLGQPAIRNADGDVAIRVGTTVVFCRSTPDYRELVLFAALVHDVSGRSRACEVLNDLNVESRYCRFALHRDRVFVQVSVPARPFVPDHLRQALESISQVADAIDEDLARKLGGRTTFPAAG